MPEAMIVASIFVISDAFQYMCVVFFRALNQPPCSTCTAHVFLIFSSCVHRSLQDFSDKLEQRWLRRNMPSSEEGGYMSLGDLELEGAAKI